MSRGGPIRLIVPKCINIYFVCSPDNDMYDLILSFFNPSPVNNEFALGLIIFVKSFSTLQQLRVFICRQQFRLPRVLTYIRTRNKARYAAVFILLKDIQPTFTYLSYTLLELVYVNALNFFLKSYNLKQLGKTG